MTKPLNEHLTIILSNYLLPSIASLTKYISHIQFKKEVLTQFVMIGQMKNKKMEYNFSHVLPIIARCSCLFFSSRNSSRARAIFVRRFRSGSGCLALGACRGTAERVV